MNTLSVGARQWTLGRKLAIGALLLGIVIGASTLFTLAAQKRVAPGIEVNLQVGDGGGGPTLAAVDGQHGGWSGSGSGLAGYSSQGEIRILKTSPHDFAARVHVSIRCDATQKVIAFDRTLPVLAKEPSMQENKNWTIVGKDIKVAAFYSGSVSY